MFQVNYFISSDVKFVRDLSHWETEISVILGSQIKYNGYNKIIMAVKNSTFLLFLLLN